MIAWLTTDLPEPDSPTNATVDRGRTRNDAPLHGADKTTRRREADVEIADGEEIVHTRLSARLRCR